MQPTEEKRIVSLLRYESPGDSVRQTVEMAGGFQGLRPNARVFIKPNIVFWTRYVAFPKWGVVTTSRVVQDVVALLAEYGVKHMLLGEGIVTMNPKDRETPWHAFETLGYRSLEKRYGLRCVNVHERPFDAVDLGDGVKLDVNLDFLESDYVVDLPVLKTHAQTVISLGIKNLKGLLNIRSRKVCHSADPVKDLHFMVARLSRLLPSAFTLIDGIYSNERGPGFDGKLRRSDLLIGSCDVLSADMVGAEVLGYEPAEIPHLMHAAALAGRSVDLDDIAVVGEEVSSVSRHHGYSFPYARDETGELPVAMKRMGIQGLSYRKYDLTMCTYCSCLNGAILSSIAQAWQGRPWDDVEVLTGKVMQPTAGKKKTILIGKCMYEANKDHPAIHEMVAVKGCPPSTRQILKAFERAGIALNPVIFDNLDRMPGFFMKKYEGRPEYDEAFFQVAD